ATCPRVPRRWLSGPWCLRAWWALAIRSDDRAFHSTVPQREGFTCTLMNCWAGSLRCQSRQTGDSSLPALGTPTPAPVCASGWARIARFALPVAPAARSRRLPRALVCPLAPFSTLKGTSRLWTANGPPWLAPATLLRSLATWKTLARHWTGHLRPWTTLLTGSESILPWPERYGWATQGRTLPPIRSRTCLVGFRRSRASLSRCWTLTARRRVYRAGTSAVTAPDAGCRSRTLRV